MRALLLALLWLPASGTVSATEVYIGVSGAASGQAASVGSPAFGPLKAGDAADLELAARLHEVFTDDLLFSRWFRVDGAGPADAGDPAGTLPAWKERGASALAVGRVSAAGGKAMLEGRLFEIQGGSAIFEKRYETVKENWRALAHSFADEAVLKLTGRRGIARTKIAFTGDATGKKEVYVADYDGEGRWQVTRDAHLCLLPRWSPDGKRLAYTTYRFGNPDIYVMDLTDRRPRPVETQQGLNLPGGFSADGKRLIYTASRQKSPNLWVKDLDSGVERQLTTGAQADAAPSFSPDGREAAFVSDRSGNPQIHVVDVETGRTRRLTDLNWSDSPAWQPTGEWIAFAGRPGLRDRVEIYLVDPTGTNLRQLTRDTGSNENPTWSPDGRFIAFTSNREGKRRRLFVMDADGSAPRVVGDIPGSVYTPSWGP